MLTDQTNERLRRDRIKPQMSDTVSSISFAAFLQAILVKNIDFRISGTCKDPLYDDPNTDGPEFLDQSQKFCMTKNYSRFSGICSGFL
jgi:hypothetical protein